ncbi:MAG: Arc family DNA-binding protein [Oscillospiraceae bacterium]|jgi:predicted DNA-binding protein|nr:Arc family DNA-binding protein [Oscillospiraceae bacterium]
MSNNDMVRFTLRIPKELLDKFGYIAEYNGRTKNKELEQMIKARINAFEDKIGTIHLDNDESM